MKKKILLVDIDGTLTEPGIWPAPETGADWLEMYANATPSTPVIDFLLEIQPMFDSVMILTGRKINASDITQTWLVANVPIAFDSMIMRAMDDNEQPFVLKTKIVKQLQEQHDAKVVLVDDDPLVRYFAREAGAHVVDPNKIRDSYRRD